MRPSLEQVCRTCAESFEEDSGLIPIFDLTIVTSAYDEFNLENELNAVHVEIEKDDGLPQQLCQRCLKQLTDIHIFRQSCKAAQIKLNQFFTRKIPNDSFSENAIEGKLDDGIIIYEDDQDPASVEDVMQIYHGEEDETQTDILEDVTNEDYIFIEEAAKHDEILVNKDTSHEEVIDYELREEVLEKEVHVLNEIDDDKMPNMEVDGSDMSSVESLFDGKESDEIDSDEQDARDLFLKLLGNSKIRKCAKCNKYSHKTRYKIDINMCSNSIELGTTEFCCFYCDEKYDEKELLEEHILESHSIDKPFKCERCEETFSTILAREEHQRTHNDATTYKCDLCDFCFMTEDCLIKHKKSAHPNDENHYKCADCLKTFANLLQFKNHSKLHEDSSTELKCKFCDKIFLQKVHLEQHQENHMKSDKPYECDKCDKRFQHSFIYKMHMQQHEGNFAYQCDKCGKGFQTQTLLNVHKEYHCSWYECEYCDRKFTEMKELRTHHSSVHSKKPSPLSRSERIKKYQRELVGQSYFCPICPRKFGVPSGLEIHMKVHDKTRKYQCNICQTSYHTSNHLKMHMNRTHTKQVTYDCPHCDRKFFDPSTRNGHVKSHKSEKIKCSYCGNLYAKRYLGIHERVHRGEKTLTCEICGEGFYYSSKLRYHYSKHTAAERKQMEDKIVAEHKNHLTVKE